MHCLDIWNFNKHYAGHEPAKSKKREKRNEKCYYEIQFYQLFPLLSAGQQNCWHQKNSTKSEKEGNDQKQKPFGNIDILVVPQTLAARKLKDLLGSGKVDVV